MGKSIALPLTTPRETMVGGFGLFMTGGGGKSSLMGLAAEELPPGDPESPPGREVGPIGPPDGSDIAFPMMAFGGAGGILLPTVPG